MVRDNDRLDKAYGAKTEEWECMQCGFFYEGKTPPRRCPDCGATDQFEPVEYFDDDDWDDEYDDEVDDFE